jgi:hypothetical protein
MCWVLDQIKRDIYRSEPVFDEYESPCRIPIDSGLNPIFNILAAYATFDS